MKEITLTKGFVTLVDDSDYGWLSGYSWYASGCGKCIYADNGSLGYMHRLITSAPKGIQVDHANYNTLDNRRANLRLATASQNKMNQPPAAHNTSGYKGVSFFRPHGLWKARIHLEGGKEKHIGYFQTAEAAAKAYDEYAMEIFGEFAWLNFPDSSVWLEKRK